MNFKIITFLLLISTIIGFGQVSNSKAADNWGNYLYSELNKENKHKDRDKEVVMRMMTIMRMTMKKMRTMTNGSQRMPQYKMMAI